MEGWTWKVLKKWQTPDKEVDNPYARWFCFVTSPMCEDGEFGDTYLGDIVKYARLIKGKPDLRTVMRSEVDKGNMFTDPGTR